MDVQGKGSLSIEAPANVSLQHEGAWPKLQVSIGLFSHANVHCYDFLLKVAILSVPWLAS
jgi:hypothetical protein